MIIELDGISRDASGNPEAEYQWAKSASMSGTYADIAGADDRCPTPRRKTTSRTATSRCNSDLPGALLLVELREDGYQGQSDLRCAG